jgi:hypothetical protein
MVYTDILECSYRKGRHMDTGQCPPIADQLYKILHETPKCLVHTGSEAFCSIFWTKVFVQFYGENPSSHTDLRWDELLHELGGLSSLHEIERVRNNT